MKKRLLATLLIVLLLAASVSFALIHRFHKPVSMVIATDIHYLSPGLVEGGELIRKVAAAGDGKITHYSAQINSAFLAQAEELAPDYLILSGDLTLNGAKLSHQELAQMLHRLEESGTQVLVIPGNHDVDAEYAIAYKDSGAEKAEALSSDEFMELYADFGPDLALSRDEQTFSYSVDSGRGLRIIMLDTNCYGKGFIKDPTLLWLEGELQAAQAAGDRVITVSHQNLYAHNRLLSFGYQLYNSKELQPLLEQYGVLCNLSGHISIQSIMDGAVPEIITSSLAVAPAQYGVLEYDGSALSYSAQETDVAKWAASQGLENGELLDFAHYAEDFFMDNCRRQVAEMFTESELSDGDIVLLQESFARLNLDYFSGRQCDLEAIADGLELWKAQDSGFMQRYLDSMCAANKDSRSLVLTPAEVE